MSCGCKIGGGPNGVCAFHKAESARRKKDVRDAAQQKWIIEQIKRIAEKLDVPLDPLP
jgi:hypothetical protein